MATKAQQQAERIKQLEKQVPTHKTQSLPKRGTAELQAKIKDEQDKAIKTLAKTSVGERRAEDFKQKFGADPKQILSGLTKLDSSKPTKPERTIPPVQSNSSPTDKQKKKQAEILDPLIYASGGGGGGQNIEFTEIQPDAQIGQVLIDIKQDLLQNKIDEIINQIFRDIDVSDLTLAERMKLDELPNLQAQYDYYMAQYTTLGRLQGNDEAYSMYQIAQTYLRRIEQLNALKIRVDVLVKFEQLIQDRTKELNDWVNAPTFDPSQKEAMLEKVKEASRIIEQALIRNAKLKDGLITELNKAQLGVIEKIKKAEDQNIANEKFRQDEQRKKQLPKIIDADEFLDRPLDKTLQTNVDWEKFAKIFTAQFDSSPEKWAKIIVDQAKGAEIAQKQLNITKVGK